MMTFKKITSLALYMAAIVSLSACSSTPDRYAFWSNDISNVHDTRGTAPNLADIPSMPELGEEKSEIDEMRERLENNTNTPEAYTDQRDAYIDYQPVGSTIAPATAPITANTTPVFTPNSVQVNYGALQQNQYIYGSSPAIYTQYYDPTTAYTYQEPNYDYGSYGAEIATLMSENASITINPLPDFAGAEQGYIDEVNAVAPQGQLLFKHGSSRLSPQDKAYIKKLAQSLGSDYSPLRIVGHASTRVELKDPFKARLVNLKMSEKRATAVYKEFQKHGIAADRLNLTAHGDSVPNFPMQGLSEEESDRRVEILID